MEKCIICGKTDMKTEKFCKLCSYIMGAMYANYDVKQQMGLFSHVIGLKIVQNIADKSYETLRAHYESQAKKEEGTLN